MQLPEPDSMTPAWPKCTLVSIVGVPRQDFVGCFEGTDVYVGRDWAGRDPDELCIMYCSGPTNITAGWAGAAYFATDRPMFSRDYSSKARDYIRNFARMHQSLTR